MARETESQLELPAQRERCPMRSKWETGELPERLALIQQLRRINPDRARELVLSTWKEEPPDERAAFIQTFADGSLPQTKNS